MVNDQDKFMTALTPSDMTAESKTALLKSIPILQHMGISVDAVSRGYVKLRLPFAPNINHVGMIYAGSLFSLAESPGGIIFNTAFSFAEFVPVVAKFDIKFIRPALSDITVEAQLDETELNRIHSEMRNKGKSRFTLALELKDAEQNIVAATHGYYTGMKTPPALQAKT
jgi:thioesterase domain-containing protein